jgi:glycosyltransferase involved in cell wall biosynthesis
MSTGARVAYLSVVVPVYRAEQTLDALYARLVPVLEANSERFEIIFVEDCGGDRSWEVIERLSEADPRVKGIGLRRNFGQHNALLCGIRAAHGAVIVTLDDDLQNPPEEIPKLLRSLDQGNDVVYGTPQRQRHGLLRDMASRVTKIALQHAMGAETARNVSAFRAFRTRVRSGFSRYRSPFVSIDVLLTWGTTRFAAVTVRHDPRAAGASGYTVRKLISHAVNMMTGFSALPLQVASIIGFVFTLFGVAVLFYVLGRYLISGSNVPGFPFLASVIAIFSGAQLFAIGVIGEYLARMHFRSMERPPYVVRARSRKRARSAAGARQTGSQTAGTAASKDSSECVSM